MIIDNQWRHGIKDFALPPLPREMRTYGCGFYRVTFDADVGDEVVVFFREEPPHAKGLAHVQPMTLIAHKGIVSTPHGIVAYVVWQIAAGTPQETYVETFLNPFQFGTLKLVADASSQTHLKFLAYDLGSHEVVSMVDFENVFDLDQLLFQMAMNLGNEEEGDFSQAVQFIMSNASVMDLVTRSI
ncbi:hypothetical protein G5V65_18180 [Rhodobacter sp. HX-7-19]|uniref:Uncharacterized protein n=1 Tax=Paragemmobacter kunshanensis TaxID=2583234 RepID=A0A6M1UAH1_9RHOB|nr:hypothetical protein [Rhodobacter kunshanensis]NGQ92823.1 hypothetical protein [Rhodobacter kunshanensis]